MPIDSNMRGGSSASMGGYVSSSASCVMNISSFHTIDEVALRANIKAELIRECEIKPFNLLLDEDCKTSGYTVR